MSPHADTAAHRIHAVYAAGLCASCISYAAALPGSLLALVPFAVLVGAILALVMSQRDPNGRLAAEDCQQGLLAAIGLAFGLCSFVNGVNTAIFSIGLLGMLLSWNQRGVMACASAVNNPQSKRVQVYSSHPSNPIRLR